MVDHSRGSRGFKGRTGYNAGATESPQHAAGQSIKMLKESGETYYLYADKKDEKLFVGKPYAYQAYINNVKNNELRKHGAFVYEWTRATEHSIEQS